MHSSSRVFDRSIPNILMQLSGNGSEYETGEERKDNPMPNASIAIHFFFCNKKKKSVLKNNERE
jgi:hypothetical protein